MLITIKKITSSIVTIILGLFIATKITFASTIKINEFYAAGSTTANPDWVEIYNDGADLSLYQLMDAVNNRKDLATATCNGNFCIINWYNYLNNSGDTIKLVLKTTIDSPLDQVIYGSTGDISVPGAGQSAIRNPDITGGWIISSLPTKGGPNNISTSTPSPTPTPNPSTTTQASPTSSSSFTISNTSSQINSDQSFNVSVNLSLPDNPNTNFYLKGAFKRADISNYFGLTKVGDDWIKNSSTYTNQYKITTDSSGNWSGNLDVKPDASDSGFTGSGDYIFKVGRYKESDNSSVVWSDNESTINIIATAQTTEQTTAPTSKPSSSTNPANTPSSINSKSILTDVTSQSKVRYQVASIAGITSATASATSSAKIGVKNQKQTNLFIWVGLIFIFAGAGAIGYIYLKKNANIRIPFGR